MIEPPGRPDIDTSSVDLDVPAVALATSTRREEARAAMAVVAGLNDCDVPIRDIAVVARDLTPYEEPLTRAAIRYGITPAFWTQIRLTATRPYRLIPAVCDLLASPTPDRESLFRPLALGWVPPGGDPDTVSGSHQTPGCDTEGTAVSKPGWPIPTRLVHEAVDAAPPESHSIDAWRSLVHDSPWGDARLIQYLDWVGACAMRAPEPTAQAIRSILGGLIVSYREVVLPDQRASDCPAMFETETAARAVVRMETLLEQVASKYAARRRAGEREIASTWTAVAGLCESLATQRPGRREHANARALDILEANDLWGREIPYLIVVGLVDGEWPQQVPSLVPAELRQRILAGDGPTQRLAPRIAWTAGRDHDQFIDTIQTASRGLICTWFRRSYDGTEHNRSPLLDQLDINPVDRSARERLLSSDHTLPRAIIAMLSDETASAPTENTESGDMESSDTHSGDTESGKS